MRLRCRGALVQMLSEGRYLLNDSPRTRKSPEATNSKQLELLAGMDSLP